MAGLTMTLHPDLGDDALATAWEALRTRDPHGTMFQSPRWLRRWDEVLGGQRRLRTRAFHRDGVLVGVVAENVEPVRLPSGVQELVRLAGGTEVTDYLGPLAAPADRAEVTEAWLAALAADRDWDEVVLGGLAEDGGWHARLARGAPAHGLAVAAAEVDGVCPRVDLTGGFAAHLARIPGRLRQEAGRKARKLTRDVGPHEVVTYGPGELARGVDDFLAEAERAEDEKAAFFRRPEMRRWFHTLAEEYGPDGTLRIHRLDVGGLTGAMTVSLVAGDTWGLYNSAFDPQLAALGPGIVLVWALIEEAAAEGRTTFDLLRGDEPYKYRFGAVDRTLHTLTLTRGTVLP